MLVTSGCHQNSVNFIAGSNLTRNKPTNQGDGKRPSEEGEGLIGYLNSPDAVHGAKNGNQIEFFGNAGAILSTTGTPKDLDVCALSIGENLEEMGSKSQSYPILASTKALDDGSFRLSIPESNLASVGIMGLDVSGKCLAMDFRPSNGRRTSFVMGSASSGWRFIRAPSQQNALTKKPKSQSSDDDFLSTEISSTKEPLKLEESIDIVSGEQFICQVADDPRCQIPVNISPKSWLRSDFTVYAPDRNKKFHAVLYNAEKCEGPGIDQVSLSPGEPTALSTYPCVEPL